MSGTGELLTQGYQKINQAKTMEPIENLVMPSENTFRRNVSIIKALPLYERFEQITCLVLTLLIALIIGAAVIHLAVRVFEMMLSDGFDPEHQEVFHSVFAMIMTVLIALEFKHSVLAVLKRHHNVVQVRTVILIALLALVRKFIVLDATKVDPMTIIGLAVAAVALGGVYWLVREQEPEQRGGDCRSYD